MGKQYVLDLEDRVKAIEVELASIRKTRPALSFADEVGGVEARHTEQSSTGHRRNVGIEVNRDNLHDSTDAEDMTDGMVAVIFSAEDDFGFFGNYFLAMNCRGLRRSRGLSTDFSQVLHPILPLLVIYPTQLPAPREVHRHGPHPIWYCHS